MRLLIKTSVSRNGVYYHILFSIKTGLVHLVHTTEGTYSRQLETISSVAPLENHASRQHQTRLTDHKKMQQGNPGPVDFTLGRCNSAYLSVWSLDEQHPARVNP